MDGAGVIRGAYGVGVDGSRAACAPRARGLRTAGSSPGTAGAGPACLDVVRVACWVAWWVAWCAAHSARRGMSRARSADCGNQVTSPAAARGPLALTCSRNRGSFPALVPSGPGCRGRRTRAPMRIDPVYVLSPRPQPASVPTRRAFLIASGTFIAGGAIGGACGYSLGVGRGKAADASSPAGASGNDAELKTTGDAELDYWRRLAVQAPLDELFEKAVPFLTARVSTYKFDDVLWRGVARLTSEIIDNPDRRIDFMVIEMVIGQIEGPAHPASPGLRLILDVLRVG